MHLLSGVQHLLLALVFVALNLLRVLSNPVKVNQGNELCVDTSTCGRRGGDCGSGFC